MKTQVTELGFKHYQGVPVLSSTSVLAEVHTYESGNPSDSRIDNISMDITTDFRSRIESMLHTRNQALFRWDGLSLQFVVEGMDVRGIKDVISNAME